MSEYPEHDKQATVLAEAQTIGEFLDWLPIKGIHLGQYQEYEGYRDPQLVVITPTINSLLADYFDIDLNAIENEKRAMLEKQRELNARVKAG